MRKKVGIVKRLFSLLLIFSLSISSFASIVSDNDGSAFITKAEFDALKLNFQSQIDNYNSSIDSKIDGAIASYLAGIKLGGEAKNLWEKIKIALGAPCNFRAAFSTTTSTTTSAKTVVFSRYNDIYEATDLMNTVNITYATTDGSANLEMQIGVPSDKGGPMFSMQQKNKSATSLSGWQDVESYMGNGSSTWSSSTNKTYNYEWRRYSYTNVSQTNGTGKRYLFHMNPDNKKYLTEYANKYCGSVVANASYKKWSDKSKTDGKWGIDGANKTWTWWSRYTTDGTRGDTSSVTINCSNSLSSDEKYTMTHKITEEQVTVIALDSYNSADGKNSRNGYKSLSIEQKGGYDKDGTTVSTTAGNANFWSLSYGTEKTIDGNDYSLDQWGYGTDTSLYCQQDIEQPLYEANVTTTASEEQFNNTYASKGAWKKQTNTLGTMVFIYPDIAYANYTLKAHDFVNTYISSVAGETVYLGGGCPIALSDTENGTIKLEIVFANVSGATNDDYIKYVFSDMQFKDGSVDTESGGRTLNSGSIKLSQRDANDNSLILTLNDIDYNKMVWINFYDDTNKSAVVTLSKCEVR